MLRILALADSIFEDLPGGSKVVAREVAKRLTCRGHEVTFLVPKVRSDLPEEETLSGYRVLRYSFRSPLGLIHNSRRAFERLHQQRPFDLLHVHFSYAALGVMRSSLSQNLPVLRHFYGPWAEESSVDSRNRNHDAPRGTRPSKSMRLAIECRLKHLIEAYCLRRSDRIVALSNYSRQQLMSLYKLNGDSIAIIPGGVDTQRFCPALDRRAVRNALALPEDRTILLTVRRLVARMGVNELLLAMRQVAARYPKSMLVIGGTGPLMDSLKRLTERYGLTRHVKLVGFIPEGQLPQYYQAADIFVLPSIALEGFGLVILEALACGTPVIGTPVGAIPEILKPLGDDFLFAGASAEAMADGICALLQIYASNPNMRRRCAQWLSARFSWESITDEIEAEMLSLVSRRSPQVTHQPERISS